MSLADTFSHEITSQNDKSIITRIETSINNQQPIRNTGQNDKSIITRIETVLLK